jgi:hypothetical protein
MTRVIRWPVDGLFGEVSAMAQPTSTKHPTLPCALRTQTTGNRMLPNQAYAAEGV